MNYNKHVILIGGLPCSGKSEFAEFLQDQFNYYKYSLIDDPREPADMREIERLLERGQTHLIITDPFLTRDKLMEKSRKYFKDRGFEVTSFVMSATKETCLSRAAQRKGEKAKVTEFIKKFNETF